MNLRTTWWLLGIAVALLTYILAFERNAANPGEANRPPLLLPEMDPGAVTAVEIRRGSPTNAPIRVEKVDGQWRLASPAYPAQNSSVENFLRALAALRQHTYITPQELLAQEGWRTIYGFDPPQASVLLEYATNLFRLEIGAKTLVGNQVYLQRVDHPGIVVADAPFLDAMPSSADAWHNPMLLPEERLAFDRIVIAPSLVTLELDPATQLWKLTRPLVTRADFNAVLNLVQELRTTRIQRFVTDNPRADLEPYGLQSPKLQLTLARGSNTLFQVQFGNTLTNEPALIYARILNYSNVVLVSTAAADLLRQPDTAFRDHTLLSFLPGSVRRIEITSKGETFAVQQVSGTNAWRIMEPINAPADSQIVEDMLNHLARLQIIDFHKDVVPEFSPFGLAPPERRYALKTIVTNAAGLTNVLLGQVDFGRVVGTNALDKIFARRADEDSVYTVSLGDTLRLPQAPFEIRDRQLWNLPPRSINGITVTQEGRTRKWARLPSGAWSNDVIVNAALDNIVAELAQLRAASWVAQGEDKLSLLGFRERPFQITWETPVGGKAQTFTVHLAQPSASRRRYAATTLEDGKPVVFEIPPKLFADITRFLSVPADAATP